MDTRELHEDVLRGAQVMWRSRLKRGRLRGEVALDPARRVVFKTVGMPWEDLAVARVVGRRRCSASVDRNLKSLCGSDEASEGECS